MSEETKPAVVAPRDKPVAMQRATGEPTPAALIQYALENNASIDQLEKMLALQERYEKREAEKAFNAAMAAFHENAPRIEKTKQVNHKGAKYKYALLGDTCDAICAEASRHGLSHSWAVEQHPGRVRTVEYWVQQRRQTREEHYTGVEVACTVTHRLGHSRTVKIEAPPETTGSKNPVQEVASTISYLQRYSLMAAYGLAPHDVDDDGRKGADDQQPESTRQRPQPNTKRGPYKEGTQGGGKLLAELKRAHVALQAVNAEAAATVEGWLNEGMSETVLRQKLSWCRDRITEATKGANKGKGNTATPAQCSALAELEAETSNWDLLDLNAEINNAMQKGNDLSSKHAGVLIKRARAAIAEAEANYQPDDSSTPDNDGDQQVGFDDDAMRPGVAE